MAGKKSAGKKKGGGANNRAKTVSAEKQSLNIAVDDENVSLDKTAANAPAEKKSDAAKVKTEVKAKSDKTGGKSKHKKPNPVVKYFKDLRSEFKKVVWPSRKTVLNNTGAVLVSMIVSGLAIWGLDTGFAALLRELLKMAG